MTFDCIQPNGEHLPVEEWAVRGVLNGTVTDPMLVRIVRGAVEIRETGWPRQPGEEPPAERLARLRRRAAEGGAE